MRAIGGDKLYSAPSLDYYQMTTQRRGKEELCLKKVGKCFLNFKSEDEESGEKTDEFFKDLP